MADEQSTPAESAQQSAEQSGAQSAGSSEPGQGASAGFDPGLMTDGSAHPAPDGEPVDPTGGSSDGGESGQDAGLSS